MYRKDALSRYKPFINEWLEYCQADLPVSTMELTKKYGISSTFSTFVATQGFFKRTGVGKNGMWKTERISPFDDNEVSTLINGFNAWKHHKKHPTIKERVVLENVPKTNGELDKYTTEMLIVELRKRGYSGNLVMHREIKI